MNIKDQKSVDGVIDRAYNDFMIMLFGSVPENPQELSVDRSTYAKAMQEVQERYGLQQGDPDFLEWVLTLVGRSPQLTSESEVAHGKDHHTESTMGEAPSGEAE